MTKNYIVSYPRSGHHGLMGFLDRTCDLGKDYCEFYTCKSYDGSDIDCCMAGKSWQEKSFNCHGGKKNIKCHDFDLGLPFDNESRYLVQIRHPFLSIQSWYQMESGKNKVLPPWEEFFEQKLDFWTRFVNKWIVDLGEKSNVHILRYNDIGQKESLKEVAYFLGYGDVFSLDSLPIDYFNPKRKIPQEDTFFNKKEALIEDTLKKVGIERLFG